MNMYGTARQIYGFVFWVLKRFSTLQDLVSVARPLPTGGRSGIKPIPGFVPI